MLLKQNNLLSEKELDKLLLDASIIEKEELEALRKESKKLKKPLNELLFERNFVSEKYLAKLIADFLKVPFVDLSLVKLKKSILDLVPKRICKEKRVIPFSREKDKLFLAMVNPKDQQTVRIIQDLTGLEVVTYLASERQITRALFQLERNIREEFKKIIQKSLPHFTSKKAWGKKEISKKPRGEKAIREIVNAILEFAIFERASEILIEEVEKNILVCFRIDSILREVTILPKKLFLLIVKYFQKQLDIPVKEKNFKGSFCFKIGRESFLLPLSVNNSFLKRIKVLVPQEEYLESGLAELSLFPIDIARIKKSFKKPEGMVVIAGPEHSGRTTLCYTFLRLLNQEEKNICTLEDSVRESIDRITQIDKSFLKDISEIDTVKAILNTNPEVVIIEGLSDSQALEELALYSQVGNLVVLKIGAEGVFEALLNLLNLTGEEYLGALGPKLLIAGRLVRRICPFCSEEEILTKETKEELKALAEGIDLKKFFEKKPRFYSGNGCSQCYFTGFQGQIGIFEVLEIDELLQKDLKRGAPLSVIREKARKKGFTSLFENALQKAAAGETSLREIIRILK